MKIIEFRVSPEEQDIISKITQRAMTLAKKHGVQYEWLTGDMDLCACHCNGNPLDLQRLLDADDSNFAHDVFGIRRHINRDTGELENCFVPRFSKAN